MIDIPILYIKDLMKAKGYLQKLMKILIIHNIVFLSCTDGAADMFTIGFQIIEGRIRRFLWFPAIAQTGPLELSISRQHLCFQPKDTDHAGCALSDGINLTGIAHALRNQLPTALLWNGDILFLKGLVINV